MEDHVFPSRVGLRGSLIATTEVRKSVGTPELGQRLGCAAAAGSVTCNASRLEDALPILNVMRPLLYGLGEEKYRAGENNEHGRAEYCVDTARVARAKAFGE
jgi:hypothetical protein